MLAKRIIPTVLVRGRTAFKGPGFGVACTRSVGSALAICQTHARRGVDELLLLDIGATPEGRRPDLDMVRELTATCFTPVTVGGGVKSIDDIDALLRAGADKVAIGAGAVRLPELLERAADRFGSQAIVQVVLPLAEQVVNGFGKQSVKINKFAGEVVLQAPHRESTLKGYDLSWLDLLRQRVTMPLVVSCGCSSPEDMVTAIRAGADAVAAGALFQFTDHTPASCARHLQAAGIEVRT